MRSEQGQLNLAKTTLQLTRCSPDFFSVTFGAGGGIQDSATLDTILNIHRAGHPCAAHLSASWISLDRSQREQAAIALLQEYKEAGVYRIVALRGDHPKESNATIDYIYANELVELIKDNFGDFFDISVGCYPEIHPDSHSYDTDIDYLKQKLDAGAKRALTQYFYNPDAYFYYLDSCQQAGISQPIIPGIMPIYNIDNLLSFSHKCGSDIPYWLEKKLNTFRDEDEAIIAFGTEVVTKLCDKLLKGGAPGLHFYTLNKAEPSLTIVNNLK